MRMVFNSTLRRLWRGSGGSVVSFNFERQGLAPAGTLIIINALSVKLSLEASHVKLFIVQVAEVSDSH